MSEPEDEGPTNDDITRALRLARKHMYGGAEPYAPAVMSFARMLAEHRRELHAAWAEKETP